MKAIQYPLLALMLFAAAIVAFNFLTAPSLQTQGALVAYRGGGQLVDYQALAASGCTANSIVSSDNLHIENTLEALAESERVGVDVFHLNIHLTKDKQFVLFHDWTLDCATNGSGAVNSHTADELLALDAGYGYTFVGTNYALNETHYALNETKYPFRAKGYRISNLQTVLDKYPHKTLWLNLKNNDEVAFAALGELLREHYADRLSNTLIITSPKGEAWFAAAYPALTTISVESTKTCVMDYLLYGWSGVFPESCSNRPILLPPDKAKYLWGYPRTFAARAQHEGSQVYLWAEHKPLNSYELEIHNGIGVITGDIQGIKKLLSYSRSWPEHQK